MDVTTTPSDELSAELLERSRSVVDLDGPQIEAWTSALFAAWDDEDSALHFVDYCVRAGGAPAALLCRAISLLGTGRLANTAAAAAVEIGAGLDDVPSFEPSHPLVAWQVTAPFGRSIIIGCGPSADADHSVLVELETERDCEVITDLLVAGPPDQLVPPTTDPEAPEQGGTDSFDVVPMTVEDAAARIAAAWQAASEHERVYDETVVANQQLVRRRIETILGRPLPPLRITEPDLDPMRGMSADEFADANRAARSTLRAAIGEVEVPTDRGDVDRAWVDVIRGTVADASWREREALLYLEWADWLGAGIGLTRAGPGVEIGGSTLVDMVNRCPEVSSTIDSADRDQIAACFDLALDYLTEAGAVIEGRLSEAGHRALPAAMFEAWS